MNRMHAKPIQNSDSWYLSVIEFLKSKNCGKINCRSRLEPRYSVCDEIECIVRENLQKTNVSLKEKKE